MKENRLCKHRVGRNRFPIGLTNGEGCETEKKERERGRGKAEKFRSQAKRKGRPTHPPLNLPSVRQATSRERPAPMIKLVGFNISGMPVYNNRRRDRRSDDKTGGSVSYSKSTSELGTEEIGAPKMAKAKGGLTRVPQSGTNSVPATSPTRNKEYYRTAWLD